MCVHSELLCWCELLPCSLSLVWTVPCTVPCPWCELSPALLPVPGVNCPLPCSLSLVWTVTCPAPCPWCELSPALFPVPGVNCPPPCSLSLVWTVPCPVPCPWCELSPALFPVPAVRTPALSSALFPVPGVNCPLPCSLSLVWTVPCPASCPWCELSPALFPVPGVSPVPGVNCPLPCSLSPRSALLHGVHRCLHTVAIHFVQCLILNICFLTVHVYILNYIYLSIACQHAFYVHLFINSFASDLFSGCAFLKPRFVCSCTCKMRFLCAPPEVKTTSTLMKGIQPVGRKLVPVRRVKKTCRMMGVLCWSRKLLASFTRFAALSAWERYSAFRVAPARLAVDSRSVASRPLRPSGGVLMLVALPTRSAGSAERSHLALCWTWRLSAHLLVPPDSLERCGSGAAPGYRMWGHRERGQCGPSLLGSAAWSLVRWTGRSFAE